MNIRRTLAIAIVAALPLTACTDTGPVEVSSDTAAPETPTEVATETPTTVATDAAADQDTDAQDAEVPDPADPSDAPGTDAPAPADEDAAGSTPATAALFFDGRQVPVAEACTGADGAVIATTEGEVTIQVVLEGGEPAMRYMAEGEELYIEDVTTSEVGATSVYEGSFAPDESEPFDVRFEVGDTSELDECP